MYDPTKPIVPYNYATIAEARTYAHSNYVNSGHYAPGLTPFNVHFSEFPGFVVMHPVGPPMPQAVLPPPGSALALWSLFTRQRPNGETYPLPPWFDGWARSQRDMGADEYTQLNGLLSIFRTENPGDHGLGAAIGMLTSIGAALATGGVVGLAVLIGRTALGALMGGGASVNGFGKITFSRTRVPQKRR